MVYPNDCVFWLLYLVQFSNCISFNTVKNKEKYNLTEAIHSDAGGMQTNEPLNLIPEFAIEKMLTSDLPKLRVKRQSSGGKYTDAAQMPQVKLLRLMLQMLKNLWAPVYVGGAHPFHHEVPKPIVNLWKEKIVEFFFPQIGDEAKKA